ncbi:hypothetical protein F2Q69_00017504 [Brassica cretica]|uniref:Uncharacterized protein n=1 Tax=Brassica cretica TaxID=69181 RepID=A0A8S9QXC9_BRACR|nr:hypothetical protein F2Q69_00017504 [Brassica cretica]
MKRSPMKSLARKESSELNIDLTASSSSHKTQLYPPTKRPASRNLPIPPRKTRPKTYTENISLSLVMRGGDESVKRSPKR